MYVCMYVCMYVLALMTRGSSRSNSVENFVRTPSPSLSAKDNLTSFAENTFDYSSEKEQQPTLYLSGENH